MKKQELIHLHGLLAEVRAQVENWEDEDFDMDSYAELGVQPTSIHKSKTEHKNAVFEIAKGITSSIEADSEPVAPTAD